MSDGSHILETDDAITVYGESYLIKDGTILQICRDNQTFSIDREEKTLSK